MKYSSKIHLSFGLGGFLDNFITAAFAVRVIAFFETEIFLGITYVGLAFILYGIWNMFNDPIAGYLSDRKTRFTGRWGRRFPWFITAAIPYAIVYLFIFTVPNKDTIPAFFWLLFTICLFDLFYSLWNTNWLALFPEKFRTNLERTRVGGFTTLFGQIGLALGMLLPPLFITYGNIDSYIFSAIMVVFIALFAALLMIPGMKEDKEMRLRDLRIENEHQGESFFRTLIFAFRQKNFLVYVFTYLTQMILFMLILGSLPYWVQYILGSGAEIEMYISGAFLIGSVIAVPLWMKLGRKLGNRKVYIIGSGVTAMSFIPLMFISGLLTTIIGTIFLGIAMAALWTLMYPTFSDVIDEIVLITGKRREGIYTGIRTFFGRFSNVLGGLFIAIVHTATGFIPEAPTQTPLAMFGIRVIMGLIPMLFYLASFVLMWKIYDLKPEKVQIIQIELEEKEQIELAEKEL
jgi:GPH family glycoside/pentoside/hexuronide:cation symporter